MAFLVTTPARRRTILIAAGALGGLVMFASGVLAARATMGGDDSEDSPPPASSANVAPAIGHSPMPTRDASSGASGNSAGDADLAIGRTGAAGCSAPLGDVFDGSAIDPSKLGFAPHLPGAGFTLESVSLRAEGECDDQGRAKDGVLVLDTRWRHDETGLGAWLSQRVSPDPVSNTLMPGQATFWADGYAYTAGVEIYYAMPVDKGVAIDDVAPAASAQTADAPASAPGVAVAPGNPDPRGEQVLQELIAAVAPTVGQECFYRQAQGDWSDLAGMGLGDPRSAVPSGYDAQVSVVRWDPPAEGCDTPAPEYTSRSMDATFTKDASYIRVGAYEIPDGSDPGPGRLEFGNLGWNNGTYQFWVSGQDGNGPLGNDTLKAIARALDSSFDNACLIEATQLTDDELAALGLSSPGVPDGYQLQSHYAQGYSSTGNCGPVPPDASGFSANWTFVGSDPADGVIEVSASNSGGGSSASGSGVATPYGFSWTSANGTSFSVNGYKSDISRDTLIAIAKSLDSGFDVSNLSEGDGKIVPPAPPETLPMPVR
ncbi:MAG: hypothetical protein ACM3S1_16985 [Hyphomicrobiales bacterium]